MGVILGERLGDLQRSKGQLKSPAKGESSEERTETPSRLRRVASPPSSMTTRAMSADSTTNRGDSPSPSRVLMSPPFETR